MLDDEKEDHLLVGGSEGHLLSELSSGPLLVVDEIDMEMATTKG